MDTLKDLWETIKLGVTERLTSPLLGTYIISWLICNYRIILILFGDAALPKKLDLLDSQIYDFRWQLPYIFFMPLAITLFYIFIYPKIAKPVYELRLRNIRDLAEIRRKIDDVTPLLPEAASRIRLDMYEQNEAFKQERGKYEQLIQDLRRENATLKVGPSSNKVGTAQVAKETKNTSELLKIIMGLLAQQPTSVYWIPQDWVITSLNHRYKKLTGIRIKSAVDTLVQRGLLQSNGPDVNVSERGRAYIVDNDLDNAESVEELMKVYSP